MDRYTIKISFKKEFLEVCDDIVENVKSLQEAQKYRLLIDNTVEKATVKDNVTGKLIIWKQ